MADARQRAEWRRTSEILAAVANGQRIRKDKKPFEGRNFDPFAPKPKPIKISIGLIYEAFLEKKKKLNQPGPLRPT